MLNRRSNPETAADPRLVWLWLIVGLIFLLILLRLLVLQVLGGNTWRLKSIGNVITTIQTPALRGEIYDRHGKALAKNRNDLKLLYTPSGAIYSYFPLPGDKARAKARGLQPWYLNSRYACQPVHIGAEKLHLSYIALMERLESELNYPQHADHVSVADHLTQEVIDRYLKPDISELLGRMGYTLDLSVMGNARLYIRPPAKVERYFPSPQDRSSYRQHGWDYHYLALEPTEKERERWGSLQVPVITDLSRYLQVPYGQLMARIEKEAIRIGKPPYTVVDKLQFPQVVYIEEHRRDFPGIMIDEYSFNRVYPLGPAAGQLLGYTGYMNMDQKNSGKYPYPVNDMVGQTGAESSFEELLHGRSGLRNLKVDKHNSLGTWVSQVEPQRGNNIYLSVDADLQAEAHRQMNGKPGALIVTSLDPGHEGEILALVNSPGIDPTRTGDEEYQKWLDTDSRKPQLNRAYGLAYEPGSTFKIVSLTAGMETGVVTTDTHFQCNGFIVWPDGSRQYCHHRTGHGSMAFESAMAQSCDVYFYQLAKRLKGAELDLKHYAEQFGYGTPTGLDLRGEASGFLPDRAWRKRHYAGPKFSDVDRLWLTGRTTNMAIGQGDTQATPLQVLMSASLVALEGIWHPPHVLFAKEADRLVLPLPQPPAQRRNLDPKVLALVKQGMRGAVTYGTCKQLNISGMQVCAKSGTAETTRGHPHSWVTGFYPEDRPRYAFVCLVEYGGSSTEAAIPIMHNVLLYMKAHDPLKLDTVTAQATAQGQIAALSP